MLQPRSAQSGAWTMPSAIPSLQKDRSFAAQLARARAVCCGLLCRHAVSSVLLGYM